MYVITPTRDNNQDLFEKVEKYIPIEYAEDPNDSRNFIQDYINRRETYTELWNLLRHKFVKMKNGEPILDANKKDTRDFIDSAKNYTVWIKQFL